MLRQGNRLPACWAGTFAVYRQYGDHFGTKFAAQTWIPNCTIEFKATAFDNEAVNAESRVFRCGTNAEIANKKTLADLLRECRMAFTFSG